MVIKYEASRATTPRETMAFRAVVEPMLMQARRMIVPKEKIITRMGVFQPELPWKQC